MAIGKPEQDHALPEGNTASALYVNSLEKGFRVLAAFSEDFPALGVTEIALRTGLDKSAAQRFSNTLHQLGFLEKDSATRRYRPARKLMEMAYTYLRHSALGAAAMPHLACGARAELGRSSGGDRAEIGRRSGEVQGEGVG